MNIPLIYTIGHGRRSFAEFVEVLLRWQVRMLVDIRSRPASQISPHFNTDELRQGLAEHGIEYHWAGRQLGGHRRPATVSRHVAMQDDSLRAFADHMDTEPFKVATRQLLNLARKEQLAIMCAEVNPNQCHRSLIADYLVLQGVEVKHLIETGEVFPHELSPAARRESLELIYDRLPE